MSYHGLLPAPQFCAVTASSIILLTVEAHLIPWLVNASIGLFATKLPARGVATITQLFAGCAVDNDVALGVPTKLTFMICIA